MALPMRLQYALLSPRAETQERSHSMSKLTVTLPDDLHEQIRQELEAQGITTGQFIEMVVTKYFTKSKEGENNMATRTIAFQVSEELYQRIKEYLNRYQEVYGRKLTQREFMLQLIEDALSEAEEEFEAATAAEEEAPEQEEVLDSEPDGDESDVYEEDAGESLEEDSGESYTAYTNAE